MHNKKIFSVDNLRCNAIRLEKEYTIIRKEEQDDQTEIRVSRRNKRTIRS